MLPLIARQRPGSAGTPAGIASPEVAIQATSDARTPARFEANALTPPPF